MSLSPDHDHNKAVKADILFLAHDLSDVGVERHVFMLKAGGARVVVAGFRRVEAPIATVAGCEAVNFGVTHNAGFVHRALAVLRVLLGLRRHCALFARADIIVARNLEMLALAAAARVLFGLRAGIVYEVLDIHRLLLRKDIIGVVLRSVEGLLSRSAQALVTSSPAFVENYFKPLSRVRLPVVLVENKVLFTAERPSREKLSTNMVNAGPPWVIGWFGMIRCVKSLEILKELVATSAGRVEVIIRGRPSMDLFPDFERQVEGLKGLRFLGVYSNPQDLERIYSEVHFTWAIDLFEEGMNSSWLLPNRLYEGGLYGAVPIAQGAVETGRFLSSLGIGVVLEDLTIKRLQAFFEGLSQGDYSQMKQAALSVPQGRWVQEEQDSVALVDDLIRLAATRSP